LLLILTALVACQERHNENDPGFCKESKAVDSSIVYEYEGISELMKGGILVREVQAYVISNDPVLHNDNFGIQYSGSCFL